MANYLDNENIMLSGQTAYFKKTGSMVNRGKLEIPNALSAHSYDEGYIAPDSVLYGTKLEDTAEYIECENLMKVYCGKRWVDSAEELSIIVNSNVMKSLLEPVSTNIQNIANSIS